MHSQFADFPPKFRSISRNFKIEFPVQGPRRLVQNSLFDNFPETTANANINRFPGTAAERLIYLSKDDKFATRVKKNTHTHTRPNALEQEKLDGFNSRHWPYRPFSQRQRDLGGCCTRSERRLGKRDRTPRSQDAGELSLVLRQ